MTQINVLGVINAIAVIFDIDENTVAYRYNPSNFSLNLFYQEKT